MSKHRAKPHIERCNVGFMCWTGLGHCTLIGVGNTPRTAYMDWMDRLRLLLEGKMLPDRGIHDFSH